MQSRFAKGSGSFVCQVCRRRTRDTDRDAANHGQCRHCWELAGLENELSDGAIDPVEARELARPHLKAIAGSPNAALLEEWRQLFGAEGPGRDNAARFDAVLKGVEELTGAAVAVAPVELEAPAVDECEAFWAGEGGAEFDREIAAELRTCYAPTGHAAGCKCTPANGLETVYGFRCNDCAEGSREPEYTEAPAAWDNVCSGCERYLNDGQWRTAGELRALGLDPKSWF